MAELDLTEAAHAACRAIWESEYGIDFDLHCPDVERWIREERDALRPVVPHIAAQVAERIAQAIEGRCESYGAASDALAQAAGIAREIGADNA